MRTSGRRFGGAIVLGLTLLTANSCSHRVLVKSKPEGATVYINRVEVGATPLEFDQTDTQDKLYSIRLEKEGYQSKEFIITPVEQDSAFGCLLFSGNAFNLPAELEFTLYPVAATQP